MFGLFQSTPQYAGKGQPAVSASGGGFLGGLFSLSTTPQYAKAPSMIASSSPVDTYDPTSGCDAMAFQPSCSVPLPIAIVVQRPEQ